MWISRKRIWCVNVNRKLDQGRRYYNKDYPPPPSSSAPQVKWPLIHRFGSDGVSVPDTSTIASRNRDRGAVPKVLILPKF